MREDEESLHAKDKAKTMQRLRENYPSIPEDDAARLHELYYNFFLAPTAGSAKHYHAFTTRLYVMNRYTDLKFDSPLGEDREAIGRAHQRVNEILAAWEARPGVEGEREPARPEAQE